MHFTNGLLTYLLTYDCAQLQYTIQHRTVLIIFCLTPRTIRAQVKLKTFLLGSSLTAARHDFLLICTLERL